MIGRASADDVVVHHRRPAGAARSWRVLALHGLAGSSSMWEAWAQRLPAYYDLWTADLPWGGAPGTAWAQDPDVGRWVARAIAGVGAPVDVVVAHSFAANALLALRDSGRLAAPPATVLVSPFYRGHVEAFDWAAISYYLNGFDRILEEGIVAQGGQRLRAGLGHDMALRVRDRIGPYGWVRFFETYLGTPSLDTASLAGPTLLVAGGADIAVPTSDAFALSEALPECRLEVVPESGHFPMLECADRFTALVDDFLSTVLAGTRAASYDTCLAGE